MTPKAVDAPFTIFVKVLSVSDVERTLTLSVNLSQKNCLATGEIFWPGRTLDLLQAFSEKLHPPVVGQDGSVIGHLVEPLTKVTYCEASLKVRINDEKAWTALSDSRAHFRAGLWGDVIDRVIFKNRNTVVVRPSSLVLWRSN